MKNSFTYLLDLKRTHTSALSNDEKESWPWAEKLQLTRAIKLVMTTLRESMV
jgi:hypothetical protein